AGQIRIPPQKIVDYDKGPRLFATHVLSTRYDNGAVTITLGTIEYRPDRLTDAPDPDKECVAVTGRVTLTHAATTDLVNSITSLFAGMKAMQAEKPGAGAN